MSSFVAVTLAGMDHRETHFTSGCKHTYDRIYWALQGGDVIAELIHVTARGAEVSLHVYNQDGGPVRVELPGDWPRKRIGDDGSGHCDFACDDCVNSTIP